MYVKNLIFFFMLKTSNFFEAFAPSQCAIHHFNHLFEKFKNLLLKTNISPSSLT